MQIVIYSDLEHPNCNKFSLSANKGIIILYFQKIKSIKYTLIDWINKYMNITLKSITVLCYVKIILL